MPGDLLTANGQVQLGSDPVTALLADPQHGSRPQLAQRSWVRNDFNPLTGMELSTFDVPLSHRHGVTPGVDVVGVRRIEFSLWLTGASDVDINLLLSKLDRITRPGITGLQELAFQVFGRQYVLYGRYRGVDLENPELFGTRQLRLKVRFVATDPVLYDCFTQTQTLYFYNGAPGNFGYVPPPQPYSLYKPNWTQVGFGGTAPPRWTISIPHTHANPAVFKSDSLGSTTDITALWVHNRGVNALNATGGQYDLELVGHERKVWANDNYASLPPGGVHVLTDFYSAYVGAGSTWWDFDPARYTSAWLAVYPRNYSAGDSSVGHPMPGSGPASTPTISWQRGYWSIGST